MASGPSVLFVSWQPPLPRDSGGRLRTFHLLEELARHLRVRLVTFDRQPGSAAEPETSESIGAALPGIERVVTVAPPARDRRRVQARAVATRRSYVELLSGSAQLAGAVRAELDELRADIVHCDSLFLGPAPAAAAARTVIAPHNSEALLMRGLAATAQSPPRRLLYRSEARALDRLERQRIGGFDHCLAVTPAEHERFAAFGGAVTTVPNGVAPRPEPSPPAPLAPDEPMRLVFVGTQSYEPNRQGLEWFVGQVLPLLRGRSRVAVQVVGAGRRGPALPEVDHLGRVEDLGAVYAAAHAAVVPLRAGGGSRLKVLEALALGVPLVSTPVGIEGFDLRDGEHALVAGEPAALADRVVALERSLRGDRELAAGLQGAGYAFATGFFWPGIGARLAELYRSWARVPA